MPIVELAMLALETSDSGWTQEDGSKEELAENAKDLLLEKADLLYEYFSIRIDKKGNLRTLPILLGKISIILFTIISLDLKNYCLFLKLLFLFFQTSTSLIKVSFQCIYYAWSRRSNGAWKKTASEGFAGKLQDITAMLTLVKQIGKKSPNTFSTLL